MRRLERRIDGGAGRKRRDHGGSRSAPWLAVAALLGAECSESGTTPPPFRSDAGAQITVVPDADVPAGDPFPLPGPVPAPGRPAPVLTYHNDNQRTGLYPWETKLTPQAVAARGLALRVVRPVDGGVNAQPLYLPDVAIGGGLHDVFYVATMRNWVYAYDANDASASGTKAGLLWSAELRDPELVARPYARGISSTPVIDPDSHTLYVLASTRSQLDEPPGENDVDIVYWLVALDVRDGHELRRVKVAGSAPRRDGTTLPFLARNHRNRPGLLLSKGSLYLAFGARSKEELIEYHGWVIRYDAQTFAQRGAFCTSPNARASIDHAGEGGGVWQGGGGLTADEDGNVYFITGNAPPDLAIDSYGNAIMKVTPRGDRLELAGFFTPEDPMQLLYINDVDLGSGGALLIPGSPHVLGGGKTGIWYLLDTATMGRRQELAAFINVYNPSFVVDSYWEGGPHLHATPAWWRGGDPTGAFLYGWSEQDHLKAYRYSYVTGRIDPAPVAASEIISPKDVMPGGMISVSSDGYRAGSAIVWAALPASGVPDPNFGAYPGRLLAFDGETLKLLAEAPFPTLPKWMPPTIADGKVFMATSSKEVRVYELGN